MVKKGRHRRYEEARRFTRDAASSFSVEDFDLDAPDPFALPDVRPSEEEEEARLAAKYSRDEDHEGEDDEHSS